MTVTAAGAAERPVTGLAAFVDADGIVFDGPVPGQRRHVAWSTVVAITPGPDGYGPDGVPASMAQLDLNDRSVMVSAPLGELDQPLAAVLAAHRARWVAEVAGSPEEPALPPPPPEDLFGYAPADAALPLAIEAPVATPPDAGAPGAGTGADDGAVEAQDAEGETGPGVAIRAGKAAEPGSADESDSAGGVADGPEDGDGGSRQDAATGTAGRRPQRRPVAALVAVVVVVVAGSIWLGTRHSSGPGGAGGTGVSGVSNLTSMAPLQALQAVVAAAHSAGSCHLVGTSSVLGQKVTLNGDSSPSAADVTQTRGAEQYRTVVTGDRTYVEGNSQALTAELGLTATAAASNAGRWIELAPADQPTAALDAAVLGLCAADGQPTAAGPGGPLALFGFGTAGAVQAPIVRLAGPDDTGGRRTMTVTVTGNAPASATGTATGAATGTAATGGAGALQVTAALVVLAASPNLPVAEHVAFTGSDTGFSVHVDVTAAFAAWGEPVDPATPPAAVPYASVAPPGS